MMMKAAACLLAAFAAGMTAAGGAWPAQSARTVLDGVYTDAQAIRGETGYNQYCAHCHAEDLRGIGAAPVLHTLEFLDHWREDSLSSLFQYIRSAMPLAPGPGPGGLSEQDYLDITTYILWYNGFPDGAAELTSADLETTLLVGLNGPRPMPPNATVRVAGCLTQTPDAWTLTRATAPARVRNGTVTDAAELDGSARAPLGEREFRLTNLEAHHRDSELLDQVAQKVQVKGVLNGQGAASRIYALSFESLGQECDR